MTFEEKLDRLDGVFALDKGCVSSGIKDEQFKMSLRADTEGETEKLLTALARQYLNQEGYTIEDINALIEWAEHQLDWVF